VFVEELILIDKAVIVLQQDIKSVFGYDSKEQFQRTLDSAIDMGRVLGYGMRSSLVKFPGGLDRDINLLVFKNGSLNYKLKFYEKNNLLRNLTLMKYLDNTGVRVCHSLGGDKPIETLIDLI
jgi:hypothetical protein